MIMIFYLITKAINKSFIKKINFFITVKNYNLLLKMIQNKLELILFINFNMHVIIKLSVKASTKDFKNQKYE